MSISDELVQRLIFNTEDQLPVTALRMSELFHMYTAGSDQDDLQSLDGDGGYLSRSQFQFHTKLTEYGAVFQLSILATAAVCAGYEAQLIYHFCDAFLERFAEADTPDAYQRIISEAREFFASCIADRVSEGPCPSCIKRCKQYVDSHMTCRFTLEDIAAELGLSPSYLSALFPQYEHMTLKEYVLRRRVNAAKRMLANEDYTISAVASSLCFCSQSHFSQVFKKYTGMTPSDYRKAGVTV